MILNAKLPMNLWGEALLIACYVHNRVLSTNLKTFSYELWKGRKPNLNYLRVWGCQAFYRVWDPKRTKLGPRALKTIFVGYVEYSKTYRLLDLESNVIVESIDIEFLENKFTNDSTRLESEKDLVVEKQSDSSIITQKIKVVDSPSEPRRSQRARKEKFLSFYFISSQALVFLVKDGKKFLLHQIPILFI